MHHNGSTQFEIGALEVPLSEIQELELASGLLEVASEPELERFLGDVFQGVGNAVGQFMRSDTAHALGGILKDAAAKALPVIGRAIGVRVAPGRGGESGGQLAQAAGSMLGLELEGLSPQDQEFEAARQFVRLAGAAANQALLAPGTLSPEETAQRAGAAAAHRFAPGLAHELSQGRRQQLRRSYGEQRRSGRRYPTSGLYGPRGQYGRERGSPPRPAGTGQRYPGHAQYGTRYGGPSRRYGEPARRYRQPGRSGSGQWRPGGAYGQRTWRPGGAYGQRPWQPGVAYGQPWRAPVQVQAGAYGQRYGASWQRPWQPSDRPYRYGSQLAGVAALDGGWFDPGQQAGVASYRGAMPAEAPVEGAADWSRPLYFFGPSPPPAPPGAPGRWVYGGLRRRRRFWRWVPIPRATQFLWPGPTAYARGAPPDTAPEPEPFPQGPDDAAAMPGSGIQPGVEPGPVAATPAAQTNGAAPPNGGVPAMAPPGDQSAQNGSAGAAQQGT